MVWRGGTYVIVFYEAQGMGGKKHTFALLVKHPNGSRLIHLSSSSDRDNVEIRCDANPVEKGWIGRC